MLRACFDVRTALLLCTNPRRSRPAPHPVFADWPHSLACRSQLGGLQTASPTRGRGTGVRCSGSASVQPSGAFGITSFLEQHKVLQRPAAHNISYSSALEEFTGLAVMAYECGLSETTLQQELEHTGQAEAVGGDVAQVEACLQDLALVWITLDAVTSVGEVNMAARATTRWAKGPAVSEQRKAAWYGFVRMIVDGYFKKRWAWYPIDRLQLELRLTAGRAEAPADVAQWAGIVYSTLHHSSPMFPSK